MSKDDRVRIFHEPNLNKHINIDIDDGFALVCTRAWSDIDESVSQIEPYCVNDKNQQYV